MLLCGFRCIPSIKMGYIPKRCIFTALSFFGIFIIYATRVNMSVAIVAMVNSTIESPLNGSEAVAGCPSLWHNETQDNDKDFKGAKYNWNSEIQGIVLSSFYYGYIMTQLPGGVLCDKVGAKWLFGGGVLITTALYLLVPLAASWGVIAVVVIRILEGIGEGLTFPALIHAISNWSPKFERSRISSIIALGIPIGNIIGSPISGYLSSSDLFGGWPSTFYLFGTIGCVWFLLWCILAFETPECHPRISKTELLYIQQNKSEKSKKDVPIPWKDIFLSFPMWAVIISHFGHNYAFLMFLTMMPTYFKTILHFDIKTNGLLSALPYVVQGISTFLASYCADKLRESKKLSITAIRKICNTIGLFGPALCCLGIIAAGCHAQLIIVLLCLTMCLNDFVYSGFNVTHIDMSPDYAGVLFAITNTISNTAGILSPTIVGLLTANGETVENWNKIFFITSAVYVSCGLFYAIFASAEVQPWGLANRDTQKVDEKKMKIFFIEPTS
ncbi:sialin-like [Argiope bruennichi]|uniref:sialin-like n=1 Tax=Argiope bruennichi TaxID=94029 RepID=UPI0024946836|nr:sialin-like [Argiope bruennichi]XP_055943017.1 sialin-like [Argiope bruennichi]XP_055943018.1 sialin-like [Argiope bruennichi]XP_055943019.1 sialin-like [Argiope bruennichi]